jgi:hypothetical protein
MDGAASTLLGANVLIFATAAGPRCLRARAAMGCGGAPDRGRGACSGARGYDDGLLAGYERKDQGRGALLGRQANAGGFSSGVDRETANARPRRSLEHRDCAGIPSRPI